MHGRIQAREELHGRHAVFGQGRQRFLPDAGPLAVIDRAQIGCEVGLQARLVLEREVLGVLLDEEVERVDHHEVGDEADRDREVVDLLGEHQAGDPVAERVLLPVDEVVRRAHVQGVRLDGRPRVRGRPQTHHVRRDIHRSGERVPGVVRERDLCGHSHSVAQNCCVRVSYPRSRAPHCAETGVFAVAPVGQPSSSGRFHSAPCTCWSRNAKTVWYQTTACWGLSTQWFSSG